jgi:hypothetical protein
MIPINLSYLIKITDYGNLFSTATDGRSSSSYRQLTSGITLPITRRKSPLLHNRSTFGGRCAWALLGCSSVRLKSDELL